MRYPAAFIALSLTAGVVVGHWWQPETAACAALAALCWVSAVACLAMGRAFALLVAAGLGFACTGAALASQRASEIDEPALRGWFDAHASPVTARLDLAWLEGRLIGDASPTDFGARFDLAVTAAEADGERVRISGGVRATVSGQFGGDTLRHWRSGRAVRAPVSLRRPARYLNPGVSDQERAYSRRGTVLLASIKSASLVEVTARAGAWEELAGAMRAWLRQAVQQSVGRWSARSAAVVTAIVIGDRAGLPAEDERRLQDAGTYHVIAISGGNLAILAALLYVSLRRLAIGPRAVAWTTLVGVGAYGALVLGGASVGRAVLMATAALAAVGLDQRTTSINAIGVAAGAALVLNPAVIFDTGLYLSFGATLALVIGMPALRRRRGEPAASPGTSGLRRLCRRTADAALLLVAATTCVEIVLFPITAFAFQTVSVAGVVLNLAAVPLMTVVQVAGGLAAITTPIGTVPSQAFGAIAHLAAEGLIESSRLVSFAPVLVRRVPSPAPPVLAAYYICLAAAVACRRVRMAGASHRLPAWWAAAAVVPGSMIVSGVFAPMHPWFRPPPGSPRLRVVFFDVAQGDAALVLFPSGQRWLVDAGGSVSPSFDVGERILRPAIWATGAHSLDTLVVTHGDPDHIGGGRALVSQFTPATVWEGIPVPSHRGLAALRDAAQRAGATWTTMTAPHTGSIGDVRIVVHHPRPPDWERPAVRNDDSLVLELQYGRVRVVLPGDIGRDVERTLARSMSGDGLVVLKVPHHGSATSSTTEWLDRLKPAFAIVSAGRANRYGHPAPGVLSRYAGIGTRVLRTDLDGAILVETDGNAVAVKTMVEER